MNRYLFALSLLVCAWLGMSRAAAEDLDLMKWKWSGSGKRSAEEVKEGDFSYRWDAGRQGVSTSFRAPAQERDWTKYKRLRVWLYSETATGTKAAISVIPMGAPEGNHYIYYIPVDWTGWKEFDIAFKEFSINRKPGGWGDIGTLEFIGHFCGPPVPGTILFINGLKLIE